MMVCSYDWESKKWLRTAPFLSRGLLQLEFGDSVQFRFKFKRWLCRQKCWPGKWLVTTVEILTARWTCCIYSAPHEVNRNSSLEARMRLIFGYCVTYKLIIIAVFEPPSSGFTHHRQLSLRCTFVCWSGCFLKQYKFEVRFKVTELLKQSKGRLEARNNFLLERQSVLCLNHTLSMAVTAELTGSKATGSILKACLSFSTASQTSPIPMRDLHTTIKLSICQSNGGKRNAALPSQRQPFRLLYSLHINIK